MLSIAHTITDPFSPGFQPVSRLDLISARQQREMADFTTYGDYT